MFDCQENCKVRFSKGKKKKEPSYSAIEMVESLNRSRKSSLTESSSSVSILVPFQPSSWRAKIRNLSSSILIDFGLHLWASNYGPAHNFAQAVITTGLSTKIPNFWVLTSYPLLKLLTKITFFDK